MAMYQIWISLVLCGIVHIVNGQGCNGHGWDYLVFTQQWPVTQCDIFKYEHSTCKIPSNVTTWVVHGVWPSRMNDSKICPQHCNDKIKFDPQQVSSIMGQLLKFWPNLLVDRAVDSFWVHEWTTHGTCALSSDAMNSELNYFQKGLDLIKQYNVTQYFEDSNLEIGSKHNVTDYIAVIKKKTGGNPKLECFKDKDSGQNMLYQIEICLKPDFSVIDCPRGKSTTRPKTRNTYPLRRCMNDIHGCDSFPEPAPCHPDDVAYYPKK